MKIDKSSRILTNYIMSAEKTENAAKLLRLYAQMGYESIEAAPIYTTAQTPKEFIDIRKRNIKAINKITSGEKAPDIIGSSEVLISDTAKIKDIKLLSYKGEIKLRLKNVNKGRRLFPFLQRLIFSLELFPVIAEYDHVFRFLEEKDKLLLYSMPGVSYIFSAAYLADMNVLKEIQLIKKYKRKIYIGTYSADILGSPPQQELCDWAISHIWGTEQKYTDYLNKCDNKSTYLIK